MSDSEVKIYSSKKTVKCNGNDANSPHPAVYLNLLPKGEKNCPYCNIKYLYKK
jgi:uncharacterized Zn-finger protein